MLHQSGWMPPGARRVTGSSVPGTAWTIGTLSKIVTWGADSCDASTLRKTPRSRGRSGRRTGRTEHAPRAARAVVTGGRPAGSGGAQCAGGRSVSRTRAARTGAAGTGGGQDGGRSAGASRRPGGWRRPWCLAKARGADPLRGDTPRQEWSVAPSGGPRLVGGYAAGREGVQVEQYQIGILSSGPWTGTGTGTGVAGGVCVRMAQRRSVPAGLGDDRRPTPVRSGRRPHRTARGLDRVPVRWPRSWSRWPSN